MVSTFILIYFLSVYKLFTYKTSIDFKLPLFLFTLFFLIYNCYPYLLLEFRGINIYSWNAVGVNIEMEIINSKILILTSFFYLFFLIGCKISYYFLSNIKFKHNHKIFLKQYNFSIIIFLVIILLYIIIFYKNIFLQSLISYSNQVEIKQHGFFFFLTTLAMILFCVLLSQKKIFSFHIILFSFLITLYSFFLSDKNLLLFLFSLLFYIYYKEKNFKNLNLLKLFFFISIGLFFFLPLFSYFRVFRDVSVSNFYAWFEWFQTGSYSFLSDTGGPLLSLKLITENYVHLDTNFFHNFLSFLPSNLRELFDYYDLPTEFAKKVSPETYFKGKGYGFSVLAESYLYLKINIFLFAMFVIFAGLSYILIIQIICKKFVPHKFSFYLMTLLSVYFSFSIVRSSYASLIQSYFRFLIIFMIIYLLYLLIKNILLTSRYEIKK